MMGKISLGLILGAVLGYGVNLVTSHFGVG
jgi:hypothetical protein